MKNTTPAHALLASLLIAPPAALAATADYQSALSGCRDEAVSTGLENEEDIKYYVDLCMQSFGGAGGYVDAETPPPEYEMPAGETAESYQ